MESNEEDFLSLFHYQAVDAKQNRRLQTAIKGCE